MQQDTATTGQATGGNAVAEALAEKIRAKTARVGVVGLGYVGLPLSLQFARCDVSVLGLDIDTAKVSVVERKVVPAVVVGVVECRLWEVEEH